MVIIAWALLWQIGITPTEKQTVVGLLMAGLGIAGGAIIALWKAWRSEIDKRAKDMETCRACQKAMVEKYESLLQVNLGVIERNTTSLDLQGQIREAAGYDRVGPGKRKVQ